ncbi:MAG: UbiA family prenyltransferase [Candidatus Nitrosocosmicus sp.]|nr:UbiA family prenyltransferase [Candidatus Nitrosocosmicus sp.]
MLNSPYLRLLRIPNIFTIPSNIILGYLIAISLTNVSNLEEGRNVFTLLILITSSIFLYLGGLVSNDYFDEKIDSVERPRRPIPSGSVSKKNALAILVFFFLIGLSLSTIAGAASLLVSVLLIIGILTYNYKIKNGFFRPYLMGLIRGLNILYGFSFVFGSSINFQTLSDNFFMNYQNTEYHNLFWIVVLVTMAMFFHVLLLTHISKKEAIDAAEGRNLVSGMRKHCYLYLSYVATIGFFGCVLLPYAIEFLFFISFYVVIISLVFQTAIKKAKKLEISESVQFLVKNMILIIILLDSVFIAGVSGFIPSLLTCLLIIPPIILSKRFSMT